MSAVEDAQAALDAWDDAHQVQPGDRGQESMRFHETAAQRGKAVGTYLNGLGRQVQERERLAKALERAKRDDLQARLAALPVVDPAELQGARWVLVRRPHAAEWNRVVRVNPTTVTCAPPFQGADQPRYPHTAIVGVKHEEKTR